MGRTVGAALTRKLLNWRFKSMNQRTYDVSNGGRTVHWTSRYLLAGYIIGFLVAQLLMESTKLGSKIGAVVSGFGLGMTGGSPGRPARD
jgi:hypothetical protein